MCNCTLQVYQFNVPTFGKGVVFDVDSKIRAEQFKFFASALQSSKLKSYIPLFAKESEVMACCHGLIKSDPVPLSVLRKCTVCPVHITHCLS